MRKNAQIKTVSTDAVEPPHRKFQSQWPKKSEPRNDAQRAMRRRWGAT